MLFGLLLPFFSALAVSLLLLLLFGVGFDVGAGMVVGVGFGVVFLNGVPSFVSKKKSPPLALLLSVICAAVRVF